MATSTTQSTFSVSCNTTGEAVSQSQVATTLYYIDSILVGQSAATTTLTLQQFQAIVADLQPAS